MKVRLLNPEARCNLLATHKIVLTYEDLVTAAATMTIPIFPESGTFPAGTVARFAGLNLITPFDFSDAAITSLTVEVGDGTDPNRLLTATELAADGTEVLFKVEGAVTQPYAYVEGDAIDALFTATGGASPLVSEATVGEVEIYLFIGDLNDLERA